MAKAGKTSPETQAQMSQRHKDEWKVFREVVMRPAIESQDVDQIKTAKALADVLKTYQEGERRTFEDDCAGPSDMVVGWAE